jgi:hypothetical protein
LYQSLSQTFTEYSEESLAVKAEGFKSDHLNIQETAGGFRVFVGEDMDYSPSTIIRKAPLALAISLFGPFPWQVRNAVMLLSSIESTVFFYLFSFSFYLVYMELKETNGFANRSNSFVLFIFHYCTWGVNWTY